jgi:hypothetical protein
MPPTLLCSAQHFGYGPLAELLAIERAIRLNPRGRDARLLTHYNPHLRSLLDAAAGRFEFVGEPTGDDSLLDQLLAGGHGTVDAVVSCYDSAAVFYGWFTRRPVFFYDGLSWFWTWDAHRDRVGDELAVLERIRDRGAVGELTAAYRRLVASDYHLTVLLAYHLATHVFARGGFGVGERFARFPEFAGKTSVVGGVIDPTVVPHDRGEREHVLVSLSGSLAPLLSFEQNLMFARGALAFALEAFAVCGGRQPWVFCCHPSLFDALVAEGRFERVPAGFTARPSFDYRESLQMIRSARALFASPGFSSIQEAAYFRTPLFFLPEQNGGQPRQFLMFRDGGYEAAFNWTVTDQLHGGQPRIGENDVEELYAGVERLWGDDLRGRRREVLAGFFTALEDEAEVARLVERQEEAARRVFGGFDGAAQVADRVLAALRRKRVEHEVAIH